MRDPILLIGQIKQIYFTSSKLCSLEMKDQEISVAKLLRYPLRASAALDVPIHNISFFLRISVSLHLNFPL